MQQCVLLGKPKKTFADTPPDTAVVFSMLCLLVMPGAAKRLIDLILLTFNLS